MANENENTCKSEERVGKSNFIRSVYDWVLSWAYTPYGALALAILAFTESSFFPIPPDILLIPLVISARKKAFKFAFICTLFSIIGGGLGYYIGYALYDAIGVKVISFFGYNSQFEHLKLAFNQSGYLWVFGAAFTPIPYKVFTIASGVTHLNLFVFFISSALGRGLRFFIVAGLLYKFGAPVKSFIDKYFNLLSFLFLILLILGFFIIKLFH